MRDGAFERRSAGRSAQAGRGIACNQFPAIEQDDAVSNLFDFAEHVRGKKQRSAAAADEIVLQQAPEVCGGERIEAARRLIEQEDGRAVEQSAGQAEAVRHPGGIGAHLAVEVARNAHPCCDRSDAIASGRARQVVHGGKKGEILPAAQATVEAFVTAGVVAELLARARCFAFGIEATEHGAAAGRDDQGGENAQKRRFARAVVAQDRYGLSAPNLAKEAAYFGHPGSASFERMYGWAWLLKLAQELHGWDDPDGRRWAANLQPLADSIVNRYLAFLPKQAYPIRRGIHPNTAFGMAFALDYARAVGRADLDSLLVERSRTYYGKDVNVPAAWEPDGDDFLSRSLIEADLVRRVLPQSEFAAWFHAFLPGIERGEPATLLQPADVTDRNDPGLVHLDGLNLSRAWCMRAIARALPEGDPDRPVLLTAAARHARASLPYVASGNYLGEHWLASFAVYMLTEAGPAH